MCVDLCGLAEAEKLGTQEFRFVRSKCLLDLFTITPVFSPNEGATHVNAFVLLEGANL